MTGENTVEQANDILRKLMSDAGIPERTAEFVAIFSGIMDILGEIDASSKQIIERGQALGCSLHGVDDEQARYQLAAKACEDETILADIKRRREMLEACARKAMQLNDITDVADISDGAKVAQWKLRLITNAIGNHILHMISNGEQGQCLSSTN